MKVSEYTPGSFMKSVMLGEGHNPVQLLCERCLYGETCGKTGPRRVSRRPNWNGGGQPWKHGDVCVQRPGIMSKCKRNGLAEVGWFSWSCVICVEVMGPVLCPRHKLPTRSCGPSSTAELELENSCNASPPGVLVRWCDSSLLMGCKWVFF